MSFVSLLCKLSEEEVEKLFNNYKAKLSGQMVKSLGHSIINMYSPYHHFFKNISSLAAKYSNNPNLNCQVFEINETLKT